MENGLFYFTAQHILSYACTIKSNKMKKQQLCIPVSTK